MGLALAWQGKSAAWQGLKMGVQMDNFTKYYASWCGRVWRSISVARCQQGEVECGAVRLGIVRLCAAIVWQGEVKIWVFV
jgi:hypothetical protein